MCTKYPGDDTQETGNNGPLRGGAGDGVGGFSLCAVVCLILF